MFITKRSGKKEQFNPRKIKDAIKAAFNSVGYSVDENVYDEIVDSVKDYKPADGKYNQIMTYYNDTIYPLLDSGKVMKQGFHKYQAIRIDDFDFRQMLSKLETLMTSQK